MLKIRIGTLFLDFSTDSNLLNWANYSTTPFPATPTVVPPAGTAATGTAAATGPAAQTNNPNNQVVTHGSLSMIMNNLGKQLQTISNPNARPLQADHLCNHKAFCKAASKQYEDRNLPQTGSNPKWTGTATSRTFLPFASHFV